MWGISRAYLGNPTRTHVLGLSTQRPNLPLALTQVNLVQFLVKLSPSMPCNESNVLLLLHFSMNGNTRKATDY